MTAVVAAESVRRLERRQRRGTCADLASGGSCRRRHRCHSPRGVPASPTPTHVPVTPTPTPSRACRWQAPAAGPVTSAGPDLVSSTRRAGESAVHAAGAGDGASGRRPVVAPHNGPFLPKQWIPRDSHLLSAAAGGRAREVFACPAGPAAPPGPPGPPIRSSPVTASPPPPPQLISISITKTLTSRPQ